MNYNSQHGQIPWSRVSLKYVMTFFRAIARACGSKGEEKRSYNVFFFLTFLPKMSILVRWGAVMGWGPWVVGQKVTSQPVPENHHGTVSSPRNSPGKTCRRRGFPRGVHCKGIPSYLADPLRAPHLSLVSCLFPRSSILWVVFPIQRMANHLLCLCASANCTVL